MLQALDSWNPYIKLHLALSYAQKFTPFPISNQIATCLRQEADRGLVSEFGQIKQWKKCIYILLCSSSVHMKFLWTGRYKPEIRWESFRVCLVCFLVFCSFFWSFMYFALGQPYSHSAALAVHRGPRCSAPPPLLKRRLPPGSQAISLTCIHPAILHIHPKHLIPISVFVWAAL